MYEDEIYPQDEEEDNNISDKRTSNREEKKIEKKETKKEKKEAKKGKKEAKKGKKETRKEIKEETQKETQYVVAQDGRKVELLDNPLPVPPRHEKREMDFRFSEFPEEAVMEEGLGEAVDEFDLKDLGNDDFDV